MRVIRRVADAQVKELRKLLNLGASLKQAAMKSGMDRKSARKYRNLGCLPSDSRQERSWRTRRDPLASVWPELVGMLEKDQELKPVTMLEWMERTYPGVYPVGIRRTLERRIRIWKAEHGSAKETYFAQFHEPG